MKKDCDNCILLRRGDGDECPMNVLDGILCNEVFQDYWNKLVKEEGWSCSKWELYEPRRGEEVR